MHAFLQQFLSWSTEFKNWYMGSLSSGGYPLIILLMAMESSVIPIPAEVVVPEAAYLAHTQGHLSPIGVALCATFGSWLGASIMYWASRGAGRPLVLRFGRYAFVPPAKVEQAERWTAHFGPFGVFLARLLPVIRHLIGIPAGILRLDFLQYSLYTLAGSLVWCTVLTCIGVYAGHNPELVHGGYRTLTLWVIAAAAIMGGLYYFFVARLARPART